MSTFPLEQNPPPAAMALNPPSESHPGGGSVGPLIGVLAIIAVLGIVSGIIGRLCSGGRIFGHGPYDLEAWIETKCASCIDGHFEPAAAPPPPSSSASSLPPAKPSQPEP
ncbi:uncharacterized protein LOC144711989 [Wolffia australiana]